MSEDYFKFLQQPSQKFGINGKDGVQNTNGTQKVAGIDKTNVQRRYQFFTGFNNGANTGKRAENVDADNAIKSAEKLSASISDETIKSRLKEKTDKLNQLLESDATENQIKDAVKELRSETKQTTSIKPAMGLC